MMKLKYAAILIVFAIPVSGILSCKMVGCKPGSGNQISEERELADFSKIHLSGAYKLIIKQDSTTSSVKITADDNLIQDLRTDIDNGELKIALKGNYCNTGSITIYATVRQLAAIEASGANEIFSDGMVNTGTLELDLSGANKLTLDLNAGIVRTKGSGATEINLKGQASEHWVELSGSGKLNALDFVTGKYHIETSGASHCKINVLNELSVRTSGAGEVEYRGNPPSVSNSESGSSSLKKIE